MDERLKQIAENFDNMKIGIDDTFSFSCNQCGKCCINREDILLSPFDLYRMSKKLNMTPNEFVAQYGEAYIGAFVANGYCQTQTARQYKTLSAAKGPEMLGSRCQTDSLRYVSYRKSIKNGC